MFGTIDANSEISHNNLISINKLKINCLESNNISYDSCFNIINYDMSILNSYIFGNNINNYGIINFVGENKKLNITQSNIDGNFSNWGIKIKKNEINISKTTFINCSNYVNTGGGVLNAYDSYINIRNCTFSNSYSTNYGGIFYINHCKKFEATELNIFNTTSSIGSVLYIYNDFNNKFNAIMNNIYHKGSNAMQGLIAVVENSANLYIKNYHGSDFSCESYGSGSFVLKGDVVLNIE
ncbi:hypothetical protein LY90DRAFT_83289 [Neocallimastix californiae]|uniref:Right handed beta helix domain-containing protein n=1 Tax=Neocallimastix californiae TaxID=1754190 RepID=A0A1Y1WQ91_9FUNG|nr:hypothetical protein LY90DRAFT_83289 [Neocallimastix californiae]|eukprot:ORX75652.1 hypothetical protein LY90DRAFT_83289 [Neocallimastix californiae]